MKRLVPYPKLPHTPQPFWCIYCSKVKVSQIQTHYIFISSVHMHYSGQPSWKTHQCMHIHICTHCFSCWLCLGVVFLPLGSAVAQVPNGPERWHLCSPFCSSCNCCGSEKWLQYPSSTARVCQQSNGGTLTDSSFFFRPLSFHSSTIVFHFQFSQIQVKLNPFQKTN